MLQVPDLEPEDARFDPDFQTAMQNAGWNTGHTLSTASRKGMTAGENGVLSLGKGETRDRKNGDGSAKGAEYREAVAMRATLDLAVVKDAVTILHQEDDEQMAKLGEYTGIRIGDIIKDQDRFIRAQEAKYTAMFTESRQKQMFQEMTRNYFTQAMERARALRNQKVRHYRAEVIERQNNEFIQRALRPENVFNDILQTQYRDMILFNLENLLAELPDGERGKRMDEASAALYRKILDTRLELDPARLGSMLHAPAVRRALGQAAVAHYEQRSAAAIRDDELRHMAKRWTDEDIPPADAKKRAQHEISDETERKTFTTYYKYWNYNKNRKNYLTRVLACTDAWNAVVDGGLHPESIPAWVRRNDHPLRDFLLHAIEEREKNGGLPPVPDYLRLAELGKNYDPYEEAEKLCDDTELFNLIACMGGPDAPAFQTVLRLLLGKMTEEDRSWFSTLAMAKSEFEGSDGFGKNGNEDGDGEASRREIQKFLERFDAICRTRKEREEEGRLDELQIREIIEKCLAMVK